MTAVDCGRNIAKSKQCIRWKFGINSTEAMDNGLSGMDCRGKEYDIVLLWSVTSGKKIVRKNGEEIHSSRGRRTEGKVQIQWRDEELEIDFDIIAYAAPPLRVKKDWKQFELQLNCISFDQLMPIYLIGSHLKDAETKVRNKTSSSSSSHQQYPGETRGGREWKKDNWKENNNVSSEHSFTTHFEASYDESIELTHEEEKDYSDEYDSDSESYSDQEEYFHEKDGMLPVLEEVDSDMERDSQATYSEDRPAESMNNQQKLTESLNDSDSSSGSSCSSSCDSSSGYHSRSSIDDSSGSSMSNDDESIESSESIDDDEDDVILDEEASVSSQLLFDCNWNDLDDEINPNEPPSMEAIKRGNCKVNKLASKSYHEVWGKLDSKYVDKKTTKSSKSPSSIKDFEGYFKPKKENIFSRSPLRIRRSLSSPIQLRKSLSNRKDTSSPSPSPRKLDLNYMYAEM